MTSMPQPPDFYPRPPRGGRLSAGLYCRLLFHISIHALREEGDEHQPDRSRWRHVISIHALREEGDANRIRFPDPGLYFYPRPPRGGRLSVLMWSVQRVSFLSTPSARRATRKNYFLGFPAVISIHALREEGDVRTIVDSKNMTDFYPRPPRGGRRQLFWIAPRWK